MSPWRIFHVKLIVCLRLMPGKSITSVSFATSKKNIGKSTFYFFYSVLSIFNLMLACEPFVI
jgi:hypothetical protein